MLRFFEKTWVGSPERAKGCTLLVTGFGLGLRWYHRALNRLWEREHIASAVYWLRPLSTFRVAPSWKTLSSEIESELIDYPSGRTTLIGHSFGTIPVVLAATAEPSISGRMVLIEPTLQSEASLARLTARNYMKSLKADERYIFRNIAAGFRRVHDLRTFPPELIRQHVEGIEKHRGPVADRLFRTYPEVFPMNWRSYSAPVMVVGGASTGRASHFLQTLLARKFQFAQHSLVPNAAHWIFGEADAAMVAMLSDFIEMTS